MARARKWWIVYGALAAADTALVAFPHPATRRVRAVTKAALMPAVALAFTAETHGAPGRRWTLAGLGLSWVGDTALLRPGPAPFLSGLTAFLGAHLAYLVQFRQPPPAASTTAASTTPEADQSAARQPSAGLTTWPFSIGPLEVAALASVPVLTVAAWRRDRTLAGPVAAYGLVINAMGWSAADRATRSPSGGAVLIRRGARLFVLSDLLLGVGTFVTDSSPRGLNAAVWRPTPRPRV